MLNAIKTAYICPVSTGLSSVFNGNQLFFTAESLQGAWFAATLRKSQEHSGPRKRVSKQALASERDKRYDAIVASVEDINRHAGLAGLVDKR